MVERIMLLKLVAGVSREEVARLAQATLSALPALRELAVGLPSDEASEKSWDVSVIMRFATQAELDAALASSIFAQHMESELAGKTVVVKAWSFARVVPA
jgi:hypothetical protein